MKRIIILGAGISGLTLGWFLKRRFGERISLTIIEKEPRVGGWIRTLRKEGFLFEQGPRSLRVQGAGRETLKFLEEINLQEEIIPADISAHRRYLWRNQRLRKLPTGISSFLVSPLTLKILPAVVKDLFEARSTKEEESIYDFITRRFSRTVAEELMDPLVSGIYAGDIRKLSLKSCFPVLHEWEKNFGSVLKGAVFGKKRRALSLKTGIDLGKASLFSLKHGIESIPQKLFHHLKKHILLDHEAKGILQTAEGVIVTLGNGATVQGDRIFSTLPAFSLGKLLLGLGAGEERSLFHIPAVSVAAVNFGFHRKVLKKKGFGYLVPSKEKEKVLGVVFDSSVFPQHNLIPEETRLTVMIGGAHFQNFNAHSDQDFLEIAKECLDRHLSVSTQPDSWDVSTAREAIPQYHLGHSERIKKIETLLSTRFPKVTIHGNSYYGVSVNDCIVKAKRIVEQIKF